MEILIIATNQVAPLAFTRCHGPPPTQVKTNLDTLRLSWCLYLHGRMHGMHGRMHGIKRGRIGADLSPKFQSKLEFGMPNES